ncbi:CDP-archaeol synthase [Candidatus Poribacteria bacterium]|nr:CDP-archaeol synthase [Candidatus Poribacteria bacterium]
MLSWRILSSVVLIPAILFILYYTNFSAFLITIVLIELLSFNELVNITKNKNIPIKIDFGIIGIFILAASFLVFQEPIFNNQLWMLNGFLFIGILLYFLYLLIKKEKFEFPKEIFSLHFFVIIYIGWLLNHAALLYKLSVNFVLLAMVITWSNDTGAYAIGTLFGKHKLAPMISPKKSWEGSIAGIVFGAIVAVVFKLYLFESISYLNIIIGGILISIAGQIGDLFESFIKRSCNVKDSGNSIPGHGGLLDRIDSLIFAFPMTYYFFKFIGI